MMAVWRADGVVTQVPTLGKPLPFARYPTVGNYLHSRCIGQRISGTWANSRPVAIQVASIQSAPTVTAYERVAA